MNQDKQKSAIYWTSSSRLGIAGRSLRMGIQVQVSDRQFVVFNLNPQLKPLPGSAELVTIIAVTAKIPDHAE
jgi:aconitase B